MCTSVVIYILGSPFKFHVDSITSGHITAYGPGLTHGVSGEPSDFTIYTKGAGAGTYNVRYYYRSKTLLPLQDHILPNKLLCTHRRTVSWCFLFLYCARSVLGRAQSSQISSFPIIYSDFKSIIGSVGEPCLCYTLRARLRCLRIKVNFFFIFFVSHVENVCCRLSNSTSHYSFYRSGLYLQPEIVP